MKFSTQLRGDKINYNVGPRNLEPALEQQDDLVRTVKLTYHPGEEFGDENTYTAEVRLVKRTLILNLPQDHPMFGLHWAKPFIPSVRGREPTQL